ncbi:MAG: PEGA domain-containing protein, partial [Myxococcota bacterium]
PPPPPAKPSIVLVELKVEKLRGAARDLVEEALRARLAERSRTPLPDARSVSGAMDLAGIRKLQKPEHFRAVAKALSADIGVQAKLAKSGDAIDASLVGHAPAKDFATSVSRAFPAVEMSAGLASLVDDLLRAMDAQPAAPGPGPGAGSEPTGTAPLPLPTIAPTLALPIPGPSTAAEPAPAAATAPPSPDSVAEARRHFDQGVVLFDEGAYDAALAEFHASYELNPVPSVLFNVGLTQKALYRYGEAIATLEKFLADAGPKLSPERRAETEKLVADMRLLLAEVAVEGVPAGALLVVDGREAGVAPLAAPLQLAAGPHTIEASAEGFRSRALKIVVAAGVPQQLSLTLQVIPKSGLVTIGSKPIGAQVLIDGKAVGRTPFKADMLARGYQLELRAKGFRPYRGEITVTAGKKRNVNLTLEEEKPPAPWYTSGWVWGAGAVVAAGATIAVVLVVTAEPQEPIDGTLPPGQTSVGAVRW